MKEILPAQLKSRLLEAKKPFLLDVRQPEEFAENHIEGAVLIPLGQLPARHGELDKSAEIVVNCKSGGRSAQAVAFLESQGFINVSNLVGGLSQWLQV